MKMQKGFTLIELMVVIAVIGILASIALVSLTGVQRSARDSQRKSDLASYRTALEGYHANNTVYPATVVAGTADTTASPGASSIFGTSSPLIAAGFMPKAILDPSNNNSACKISTAAAAQACLYKYLTNTGNTSYVIWAIMENPNATGGVFSIDAKADTKTTATEPTAAP